MAVRDGSGNPIQKVDLRVGQFYTRYLRSFQDVTLGVFNEQSAESCQNVVNSAIKNYFSDKSQANDFLQGMYEACGENILSRDEFNWLERDPRATFYIWVYLCDVSDKHLGIDPNEEGNWYRRLDLSLSPSSHNERLNLIISLFDLIPVYPPAKKGVKRRLLENIKNKWKGILNGPKPLKWLPPDDKEGCQWVWEKLRGRERSNSYIESLIPELRRLEFWFTPLSPEECYLAAVAAFDSWGTQHLDSKKLFLLNLNKAWNQRKLRQSRTDKKALNSYLRNQTKSRLDELAEYYGMRISDVLEKLINDHYLKKISKDE
ncbi:hypothetical protein [Serratia sp. D1N4]